MQRIAVIGLGQLGSRLAESLIEQGAEVLAIDIDPAVVDARKLVVQHGSASAALAVIAKGGVAVRDGVSRVLNVMALKEKGSNRKSLIQLLPPQDTTPTEQ